MKASHVVTNGEYVLSGGAWACVDRMSEADARRRVRLLKKVGYEHADVAELVPAEDGDSDS